MDIVKRLREAGYVGINTLYKMAEEAADEIEKLQDIAIKDGERIYDLQKDNERLREDKNLYAETIYELEKDIRVKDYEIKRLREALKNVLASDDTFQMAIIARDALNGD